MARVALTIGGITHEIACRDGGEDRLRQAAALVDGRMGAARAAAGGNAGRATLLAALMLADSLIEADEAPPAVPVRDDAALEKLAERMEALADALEAASGND